MGGIGTLELLGVISLFMQRMFPKEQNRRQKFRKHHCQGSGPAEPSRARPTWAQAVRLCVAQAGS